MKAEEALESAWLNAEQKLTEVATRIEEFAPLLEAERQAATQRIEELKRQLAVDYQSMGRLVPIEADDDSEEVVGLEWEY